MTSQPIPQPPPGRTGIGGIADLWALNTGQDAVERARLARGVLEEYRRDVHQGTDMSDCVTQDFLYARRLVADALARAQVQVAEAFWPRSHDKSKSGVIMEHDGKNYAAMVEDFTIRQKTYTSGHAKVSVKDPYGLDYAVVRSKVGPAGEVVCPNCGGVSTPEQLVTGCPYCGTHYRVEDFQDKITFAVLNFRNLNWAPRVLRNCLIAFPAMLIVVVAVGLVNNMVGGGAEGIIADIFSRIAFPPVFFCIVGLASIIPVAVVNITREQSLLTLRNKLRKHDPYFSDNQFRGTVDHRLKAWALESDPRARGLVSGLPAPAGVLDIDILEWRHAALTPTPDGFAAELRILARIVAAEPGKLWATKQKFTLTLIRDEAVKTDFRSSIFFVPCTNCGASISLIEGARCRYCGTGVRPQAYDWVLTAVR
jgi:hypothetical protein